MRKDDGTSPPARHRPRQCTGKREDGATQEDIHQENVKTSPGPPRGVMVPLVFLVHPDPSWSTFLVKFQKVCIRMDRSGPGGPQGPQPPLVDQERSGPPWTTLRHFPDAPTLWATTNWRNSTDTSNRTKIEDRYVE